MCDRGRRRLLGGLLLTPLAAALAACQADDWPAGMAPIKWDRDTCSRCRMVISDRRFAAEVRGGPDNTAFKFDDPGCLAVWLAEQAGKYPWLSEVATRVWLADADSPSRQEMRWLAPERARFVIRTSPMRYNFAAIATPTPGTVDFTEIRRQVLARND